MASIKCGHCKGFHESVADVRRCSTMGSGQTPPPSVTRFEMGDPEYHAKRREADAQAQATPPRVQAAEKRRDFREKLANSSVGQTRREPAAEGFYFMDGDFYKVVMAHYGAGRVYAKIASRPDFEFDGEGTPEKVRWDYAKGAVYRLTEAHRVTPEQAAQFGKLYGRCVRCGRVLTREESIERSMGPVCVTKMGWA